MEQRIAELTDKIFKEGVEKGEEQKQQIVKAARDEAASITADAKKEAARIIAEAQKQAQEYKRNVDSEIKLSSQQAFGALKQKIAEVLLAKSVDENVSPTLADPAFVKELLTAVVANWKSSGNDAPALEAILPEQLKTKLDKSLEGSLKKTLHGGVAISFSKNFKGGFQIGAAKGSYKVSLTDDDFNEFIKEYLRPKTRTFLFEQ